MIYNNEHTYTVYNFMKYHINIAKKPDFFVFVRFVMKCIATPCCGPIENSVLVYNNLLQKNLKFAKHWILQFTVLYVLFSVFC